MEEKQGLYTIGQIAKICNITTDQLRHYDKNKIFSPKARDKYNNYRYYTESQIDDILLIKELKGVGMSLKSIGSLIRNKELELLKSELEENRRAMQKEMKQVQQRYDQLIDVLLTVTNALNDVKESVPKFYIVDVPERYIVSTCYDDSYYVESTLVFRYLELLNLVDKYSLIASNSATAIFHDHYTRQFSDDIAEQTGKLEVFYNITSPVNNCANCRSFGGFKAACTTYVGHYRNMEKIYDELYNWAKAQGHFVSGISFQEFIIGRVITDKENYYTTKIYFPLDVTEI